MEWLWDRMVEIYGHKWISNYGDDWEQNEMWCGGLHHLAREELEKGIATCMRMSADNVRHGEDDWPPTLAEFISYCRPKPMGAAYHEFLRLPQPPNNPNSAAYREFRESMKELGL